MPDAYQWLLVPRPGSTQAAVEFQVQKLAGHDPLAVRASKKLRNDDSLVTVYAATNLRRELDKVPLWRGDSVTVRQLVEDFARYLYLPRMKEPAVLLSSISEGLGLLSWSQESFAFADSYDEASGRYRGLRGGQPVRFSDDSLTGILVKPEIALRQLEVDRAPLPPQAPAPEGPGRPAPPQPARAPTRFHGSVTLDPTRVGRDAGRIADEVIAHLAGLLGAEVTIALEIGAKVPGGVPDKVVRVVTENSRTLKFDSHGFETD